MIAENGCWLWTAGTRTLYGAFNADGGVHYAHRWAYQQFVGPIRPGLEIDHLCRTRLCVNPAHLEAVTHIVNVRRGNAGLFSRNFRCEHGHAFTKENTRVHILADGGRRRRCRTCERRAMDGAGEK